MKRLLTLTALLFAASAGAQAQQIGYHGVLGRADGGTVTGSTSMRFSLYGVASGGTAVWTENKTLVLANGTYSTLLGDASPLPPNIFDGRALFLEISIIEGSTTTTLVPRQAVSAAPYSL